MQQKTSRRNRTRETSAEPAPRSTITNNSPHTDQIETAHNGATANNATTQPAGAPAIDASDQIPPAVVLTDVAAGGDITIGTVIQNITRIEPAPPADVHKVRDRETMLHLVEDIWINGLLRPSLPGQNRLFVQFKDRPDLVDAQHWDSIVQMPQQPPDAYPPDADIVAIFHAAQQSLLITGAPGSGKTTLLLVMARALIAAARQQPEEPVPVVLNLASWPRQRAPLAAWIVAELSDQYVLPAELAQTWLDSRDLALLLDGLDEVDAACRSECVAAINTFVADQLIPIVVCSRQAEYTLLPVRLKLRKAVELCPLSQPQIDTFLVAAQLAHSPLAALIRSDDQFRELASSPLMLSVMSIAGGQLVQTLPSAPVEPSVLRSHLWTTYVDAMFMRRSGRHPYTKQQTTAWLRWLARQMETHHQSTFLLEQMQPTMLANRRQRLLYHSGVRLLAVALFVTICTMLGACAGAVGAGSIPAGLVAGILIGLLLGSSALLSSVLNLWLSSPVAVLLASSLIGLTAGILESSPLEGILLGLVFGVPGSLAGLALSGRSPLRPVETLIWSPRRVVIGVSAALFIALLIGIVIALQAGPGAGFTNALVIGICLAPTCAVALGLVKAEAVQPTIVPNQRIRATLRNALRLLGLVVLPSSLLITVAWALANHGGIAKGLAFGLIVALPIGLMVTVVCGGAVVIQHYVLRSVLALVGAIPWRLQKFLDYAAERVFLRRIGGGYIFYHRLLMDYFAGVEDDKHD